MSAVPRHQGPEIWAPDRGDAVRWAVRTLAQAFGGEGRREWRDTSRQGPPGWSRSRRGEPRWFLRAPPRRPFQGSREPGYKRRRHFKEEQQSNWHPAPVQHPGDWTILPMPRRGPPVAAIMVSAGTGQSCEKVRWTRGPEPRGPPWGGPARSAEDTRPHPKQPSKVPTGGKPKSRGRSQDQSSSRWTRAAGKERGDRSPERMRGESGQCGKTWVAM